MKRILIPITLLLIVIFFIPSNAFPKRGIEIKEVEKQRLALVIGNGAYRSAPLRNPVNDAKDMAEALRGMGFEVLHKENAAFQVMDKAVMDFGRRLRGGAVGLFYFAGHGIQMDGRNYLIPVDAEIETESDVRYKALDAGRVLGKMENAGNILNIVILDACRNNPFVRSFRTSNPGLAKMDAPKGSLVAYATAPGSVADDGTDRNGIYTKYLLKHMNTPGLKVEEVLKKVRNDVMRETGDKQVPWEHSSLRGDFYFIIEGKVPVTNVPPKEGSAGQGWQARVDKEALFWESIKDSNDPAVFKTYLEQFPDGTFASLARHKIEKGKEKTEAASLPFEIEKTDPNEVARDGHYVAYASGVVRDTSTGLEWVAGPDRNATWYEAESWVASLNIAGGGWRMPTVKELEGLFRKGAGTRNMTPLLKTTGWAVWSGEIRDSSSAWTFLFRHRKRGWDFRSRPSDPNNTRAFAVRSRGD